jgi:hypothetical protein
VKRFEQPASGATEYVQKNVQVLSALVVYVSWLSHLTAVRCTKGKDNSKEDNIHIRQLLNYISGK